MAFVVASVSFVDLRAGGRSGSSGRSRRRYVYDFAFFAGYYRNGTLLNALGACALILLVWRRTIYSAASFQLTFVSVASDCRGGVSVN
jgi:hypothetical protein